MVTLKKYFKVLHVFKTHFNNQVNNLDHLEGEQLVIGIKHYLGKIKRLIISRKGNL